MRFRYTSVDGIVRLLAFAGLALILCAPTLAADRVLPGTVQGVVWTSDNSPVANAKVRLRNIEDGRVVAASETSARGEFVFAAVGQSSYLVELVSDGGKVLAVSASFLVAPGETISTVVRLPARRSWYAGMFSNAGAVVIGAAATAGVVAIASHAPPVSPQ